MNEKVSPGSIKIEIVLDDGSHIPGVTVTIYNRDRSINFSTITDERGVAIFKQIPSGTYTIKATLEGFKTKILEDISIKVGESRVILMVMETTIIMEEIVVISSKEFRDEPDEYIKIPVFYGTNRKRRLSRKPRKFYGGKRGKFVLGQCLVSIPQDHKMGEIETPSIFKLEFRRNPKKHIVLLEINQLSHEDFFDKLRSNVHQAESKEAIVFIHGFNTTFEEAAQRTAQLAYDLGIETPIMFSWPSRGKLSLRGYTHDETNVEWTIPDLQFFLKEISEKSALSGIHLIAHSMGNRALTNVLKAIRAELAPGSAPHYNEVILTAPDIDADTFKNNIAPRIINGAERITLYASSDDKALSFSKTIHGYPRAGEAGEGIVVVEGIDTIDVTPLNTGFWGHSYFAENRNVMNDLFMVLKQSAPPKQRNLIKKEINGGCYWSFRK